MRKGVETSPYQLRRDAKVIAGGCERCEDRLLGLMADFVDGLHRVARRTPQVESAAFVLEQAAERYLGGDTSKESLAGMRSALEAWLLMRREQSELEMARLRALSVVTGDWEVP